MITDGNLRPFCVEADLNSVTRSSRSTLTSPSIRRAAVILTSVTIFDAAAPVSSQLFMIIGAGVLLPVILAYTTYAYWVFRGKGDPRRGITDAAPRSCKAKPPPLMVGWPLGGGRRGGCFCRLSYTIVSLMKKAPRGRSPKDERREGQSEGAQEGAL